MPDVHASPDSEHGDDVGFRGGYGIPAVNAANYWASLRAYVQGLLEYVEWAFLFQAGAFDDWASHESLGSEIEGWWAEAALEGHVKVEDTMTRTQDQQTWIDILNGVTNEFSGLTPDGSRRRRLTAKRRAEIIEQQRAVVRALETEAFPKA